MTHSKLKLAIASLLLVSPLLFAAGMNPDGGKRMSGHLSTIDSNGDGVLTADEISAAQDARIARLDANRDGIISVQEVQAERDARRSERMQERLLRMDSNGDGVVSTDEARAAGHDRLMKLDANGDGEITRDELRRGHHRGGKRGRGDGPGRHGTVDGSSKGE